MPLGRHYPVEERLDCQNTKELSVMVSLTRTFAEFPTQEQRELRSAIEGAEALDAEIGDALRNPDGFPAFCAGSLYFLVERLQALQDYQAELDDPPLLYLDYKLASNAAFLTELADACP